MNTPDLMHLIYASAAAPGFELADLKPILDKARDRNAERAITGVLLYTSGNFFQVLEGDDASVSKLFLKISADPRHQSVTKIIQEPIIQRDFGDWKMGYGEIDPAEFESIEGFTNFFQEGNSLVSLAPGRAKKLLSAFAQGRWRARIQAGG